MKVFDNEKRIISVSELNASARLLLESHYPMVWVEGELSNFSRPRSGHWYFTLKDATAQLRCAMFVNRNRAVRFRPTEGQQIIIRGHISLYEGRGDFQAIVEDMQAAGEGALRAAFDALKEKLAQEGLFAEEKKQPLPPMPGHVAVITSRSGAALHDILSVLGRRFPLLEVTLLAVSVQGSAAENDIIKALKQVAQWPQGRLGTAPEAIVLARGGGSLEDLWTFNLESVARAIVQCPVPIISAIGHETDFTISDFVADRRAPTPSAAAELLVPDQQHWLAHLERLKNSLISQMTIILRNERRLVSTFGSRLIHPGRTLQQQMQRVDRLERRFEEAVAHRLEMASSRFALAASRLQRFDPEADLVRAQRKLTTLEQMLRQTASVLLDRYQSQLREMMLKLHAASPLNALEHGYAIVTRRAQPGMTWGGVISSTTAVQPGSHLTTYLRDGLLQCEVTEVAGSPLLSTMSKLSTST